MRRKFFSSEYIEGFAYTWSSYDDVYISETSRELIQLEVEEKQRKMSNLEKEAEVTRKFLILDREKRGYEFAIAELNLNVSC